MYISFREVIQSSTLAQHVNVSLIGCFVSWLSMCVCCLKELNFMIESIFELDAVLYIVSFLVPRNGIGHKCVVCVCL